MNDAIARLTAAQKRLANAEGRIARRNARRAFFGSLQSLKAAVDTFYPVIAKPELPKPKEDPLEAASKRLHWRDLARRFRFPDKWDIDKAKAFNEWFAQREYHGPGKPIEVSDREIRRRRTWGWHYPNKIVIIKGQGAGGAEDLWDTIIHEVAHYNVKHHRQAFSRELGRVYKL